MVAKDPIIGIYFVLIVLVVIAAALQFQLIAAEQSRRSIIEAVIEAHTRIHELEARIDTLSRRQSYLIGDAMDLRECLPSL